MAKPKFITFTGVDLETNPQDLIEISKQYPTEWGILFSPTNTDTKYQLGNWFAKNIQHRTENHSESNFSAHLCGGYAREVLETGKSRLDLSVFKRIQINSSKHNYDVNWGNIYKFWLTINKPVIIQWRQEFKNNDILFPNEHKIYNYLYDCSGGRGIVAEQFPKDPGYFVGFAGGFGPDNVVEQLAKIDCKNYYIDMEGAIRTENKFDLDKVKLVCERVYD